MHAIPVTDTTTPEYVEAIAVWASSGPSDVVWQWLDRQRLQGMPMQAGVLIRGTRHEFERAFGVDLGTVGVSAVRLPVPGDLQDAVSEIVIRQYPTIHVGSA